MTMTGLIALVLCTHMSNTNSKYPIIAKSS